MAINPETQYPGKIEPASAEFPYGKARNITLPSDGKGTPWEAALVNDLFGFQQALLSDAGVVPSGTPDEVGASQYLQSLFKSSGLVKNDYTLLRLVESNQLSDLTSCFITADGIGGSFVLNKTDTTTADNNGTVIVDADGGRWKRIFSGEVNVIWFGVEYGTGKDNTAKIQNAHDSLPGVGGELFFPLLEGTAPFDDSGKIFCDSGLTITKPVRFKGVTVSQSFLAYTGTGIFLTVSSQGMVIDTMTITGVDGAASSIFVAGSTGIEATGVIKTHLARISKFEIGVEWKGGYYHEFHDTEIDRCKILLNNFAANNLSFLGGRLHTCDTAISCNTGAGPVNLTGTAIEKIAVKAFLATAGLGYDITLTGCYVENNPNITIPVGLTGAGGVFDSGQLIVNGDGGTVTLLGNMMNTKGFTRIVNHSTYAVSNIVSLGNTFILHNLSPDDTLTHIFFLGTTSRLLGYDVGEGTAPGGAIYAAGVDEGMYEDIIGTEGFVAIGQELKSVVGISSGGTAAKNLAGHETFATAATKAVTFGTVEPNTNYRIAISGDVNETFWVTAKTTSGFTLNSSNASSVAGVDWHLLR